MEPWFGRVPLLSQAHAAGQLRHRHFSAAAPQDMPAWWARLNDTQRVVVTGRSAQRSALRQWHAWFCANPDVPDADIETGRVALAGGYDPQPSMLESIKMLGRLGYGPAMACMFRARDRVIGSGVTFAQLYNDKPNAADAHDVSDADLCVYFMLAQTSNGEHKGGRLVLAGYEALDLFVTNLARTCAAVDHEAKRQITQAEYKAISDSLIRWLTQRGYESRAQALNHTMFHETQPDTLALEWQNGAVSGVTYKLCDVPNFKEFPAVKPFFDNLGMTPHTGCPALYARGKAEEGGATNPFVGLLQLYAAEGAAGLRACRATRPGPQTLSL